MAKQTHRRKFEEASKTLSIRVPESRFNDYKLRFNYILAQDKDKSVVPFTELSQNSVNTLENILDSIKYVLSKKGTITTKQYNEIIKATDFRDYKQIQTVFKTK